MTDRKQDIVERLRARQDGLRTYTEVVPLSVLSEAAEEIEHLRLVVRIAAEHLETCAAYLLPSRHIKAWAIGIRSQVHVPEKEAVALNAILADAPPCPSTPGSVE